MHENKKTCESVLQLRENDVILLTETQERGTPMFDKTLFLYYGRRRGETLGAVANMLKVSPATLTRKMSGISDFTREEIHRIRKFLMLTTEEADHIFFAEKLA